MTALLTYDGKIKVLKGNKNTKFNLPKGHTAEHAFLTALCWVNMWYCHEYQDYLIFTNKVEKHFGEPLFGDGEIYSDLDKANFYLLLAVANGHDLE